MALEEMLRAAEEAAGPMNDERILDWILVTGGSLQAQRDERPLDGELALEIADMRQQQAWSTYTYPMKEAGPTPESSLQIVEDIMAIRAIEEAYRDSPDQRARDHTQDPAHQEALRVELAHRLQEKGIPAAAIGSFELVTPLMPAAELRRGIFASLAA